MAASARALFSAPPCFYSIPPLSSLASRVLLSHHRYHFHAGPVSFSSSSFSSSSHRGRRCYHRACTDDSKDATSSDSFVLTTPLYYVNAPPHMGSAYTTIAADAIARFQRLLGKKVIFITGTDEHGEKIASAAEDNDRSPKEHCDVISQSYRSLWSDLQIDYDKFIRTTDPKHETVVNDFYARVLDSGDIYRADYEGLYCVNCEEYKDEKELTENKCCPVHLKPCLLRKEDNYFFALSKYQSKMEELLTNNPEFVKPSFRLNEVQSWIKSGLRDFSISRASVDWGIPVPNDTKQTIYVWFDALLGCKDVPVKWSTEVCYMLNGKNIVIPNEDAEPVLLPFQTWEYVSALLEDGEKPNLHAAVSSGWPASLHLIGKDILRFHAVYWPAMLMSAGLEVPKMVFGHGFLTKDGMKMGKSLGNTLEPTDLVDRFGADAVRYFFLREVEFGNDGDYSEERFINIVNAHLANTIGNLLNRTLGLLKKNCESTLHFGSIEAAEGNDFRHTVEKSVEMARYHYENLALSSACEAVLDVGNSGNLYIDERAPWSCFKKGGETAEMAAKDLVLILEALRIMAVALSPVAPSLCARIYTQLGFTEDQFKSISWADTKWGMLQAGQKMNDPRPVFARIEIQTEEELQEASPKQVKKGSKKASRTQGLVQA